jgi:hypothetical protein
VSREPESVPEDEVGTWKTGMLPSLLSECNSNEIINAYECGLFFSLLPHRISTFKDGGKRNNIIITELVWENMDGCEMMPQLVTGKSQKPRRFKYVKSLPCSHQKPLGTVKSVQV